ncbi:unnamed protein product [Microthlaspi erraticum]|uniref:Transmembrane protein n=1 Tax=Microthlaspi erraticum TaxID=1685480 RepID=A0A6D2I7Z6_9BRAS|nr:unnamed protein product [Microthlaspi erraticum]
MEPSPSTPKPPQKAVPRLATFGWRAMLIFNLGLAAYIFARKHERDIEAGEKKGFKKGSKAVKKGVFVNTEVDEEAAEENSKVAETDLAREAESVVMIPEKEEAKPITKPDPLFEFTSAADQLVFQTAASEPVQQVARKPIPEDEQRELFKWILEEKRKIQPKDRKEKKRIDEEKAILKQFIEAKRIPKFLPDDSVDSSLRDWDKFFSK